MTKMSWMKVVRTVRKSRLLRQDRRQALAMEAVAVAEVVAEEVEVVAGVAVRVKVARKVAKETREEALHPVRADATAHPPAAERISLPDLSGVALRVERLTPLSLPRVISFYEQVPEYLALEEEPPTPTEAAVDLLDVAPPGIPHEQKFVLGILNEDGLIGLLDVVQGYPSTTCYYVGLLVLLAEQRGHGLGELVLEALERWVTERGGQEMKLAVLLNNPKGLAFWRRNGFELEGEPVQRLDMPGRVHRLHKRLH